MSDVFDQYLPAPGSPLYSISENGSEQWAEQNKGVQPIFYMEPVKDEAESVKQGRPIFTPQERVMIIVAGDQLTRTVHPVDEKIIERFPEHYRKFQANHSHRHIEGTPIRAWPLLEMQNVAEFEALGIFSVEALATISDAHISKAPNLRDWANKAKSWLAGASNGAEAVRLAAENAQLKSDQDDLRQQIAELAQRISANEGANVPLQRTATPRK